MENHQMKFIESHYFSLPSQGNIYTLLPLQNEERCCKLLVASLKKKIFCIEYCDGKYLLHENPLTCVPTGVEIISMNAYNNGKKFNIGLAMIMKDGACEQSILNLYSEWDIASNINFSHEVTRFTSIKLGFIPYVLQHTLLPKGDSSETVWLLSGSDCSIHLYHLSKDTDQYQEDISSIRKFPEFDKIHGITLHLDILYSDDEKSRITVTSGESGNVHIFNVDVSNIENINIKASREINFDYPASSVKLFYQCSNISSSGRKENEECKAKDPLLVLCSTLESCFVYSAGNITDAGLQLPESENFDVVTSCLVCDFDFDGINEIMLATYGQVILIYKEIQELSKWKLIQTLSLPSPVLSMAYEDILGDGVCELIVNTMNGVHIFQSDSMEVAAIIIKRIQGIND